MISPIFIWVKKSGTPKLSRWRVNRSHNVWYITNTAAPHPAGFWWIPLIIVRFFHPNGALLACKYSFLSEKTLNEVWMWSISPPAAPMIAPLRASLMYLIGIWWSSSNMSFKCLDMAHGWECLKLSIPLKCPYKAGLKSLFLLSGALCTWSSLYPCFTLYVSFSYVEKNGFSCLIEVQYTILILQNKVELIRYFQNNISEIIATKVFEQTYFQHRKCIKCKKHIIKCWLCISACWRCQTTIFKELFLCTACFA